ncbi:MAG: hypothetical protein QOI73_1650 [Solirubrobacteraceae bacterium]|nr:hypothetical protein [Solirubrobacteraceae bacterium]
MTALEAGIVGGFVGGALGVLGTTVTAYWGPRKLEQWRLDRLDEPRKKLLKEMLDDPNPTIRSLDRLRIVTGTSEDECRRLLIAVKARGVRMRGGQEGWALIDRWGFEKPVTEARQPDSTGSPPAGSAAAP